MTSACVRHLAHGCKPSLFLLILETANWAVDVSPAKYNVVMNMVQTIIGVLGLPVGALILWSVVGILNRRVRFRKKPTVTAALLGIPVLYVLLTGPLSLLSRRGDLPQGSGPILSRAYLPFRYCYNHSPRVLQTTFWFYQSSWLDSDPSWKKAESQTAEYPQLRVESWD